MIEDCSSLRFAPYALQYAGIDEDYTASGLDRAVNTWNDVDDFFHLNKAVPSPNWSVLPAEERREWSIDEA